MDFLIISKNTCLIFPYLSKLLAFCLQLRFPTWKEIMLFRFNFTMLLELHSMYNDILFFFHWINKQVCSTNIFTKPLLTLWSRKTHAEHNQWTYLSAMISDEKRNGRKDECVERCLRLAYFLLCMLFHSLSVSPISTPPCADVFFLIRKINSQLVWKDTFFQTLLARNVYQKIW